MEYNSNHTVSPVGGLVEAGISAWLRSMLPQRTRRAARTGDLKQQGSAVVGNWRAWLERFKPPSYSRRSALILINGLAEQAESWYRNRAFWNHYFDVHAPNVLVYDGAALHRRIDAGLPVSVDYLVEQLHHYVDAFVQTPPYHLVASSLGGKVAIEFAVRYPELVGRMVLLCPSGLGDEERMPVLEGVRRSDARALVESVFYDPRYADLRVQEYYRGRLQDRRWRIGLLRTLRGTLEHCVRDRLREVTQPTLLVCGAQDRIVDPEHAARVAQLLPRGCVRTLPRCGHAPQIEKAQLVNRLVVEFLTAAEPVEVLASGGVLAGRSV